MMSSLRVQKLVEDLFEGYEDLFTQGLSQELDMRKQELCKNLSAKIFEQMGSSDISKTVDATPEVKKLISIINEIDEKRSSKIQFKNASIINISEEDIKPVKLLFDHLNESNQKLLAKNLFDTPNHFKQTVQFAKKLQGYIK